jgi:hypothetical protein
MAAQDKEFSDLNIEIDSTLEQYKTEPNLGKLDARHKIYMAARQETGLEKQDFWAARNEQLSSFGLHRLGPESLGVRIWLLTLPDYNVESVGRK